MFRKMVAAVAFAATFAPAAMAQTTEVKFSTEKSTINTGKLNAVSSGGNDGLSAAPAKAPEVEMSAGPAPVPKACAIDEPDCEACQ